MKSKVLLLALATTAISLTSNAQGKPTFGVRAGINFQNLNGNDQSNHDLDFKLKPGFNVGVTAEIPVAPEFYVQTGLLFSTKGAKEEISGQKDVKINVSYLEVPFTFLYKPELGAGKLLLGVGPYIAFGVGGKVKQGSDKADVKFTSDAAASDLAGNKYAWYTKRTDLGGNLLAGYELSSKISFQFNAQLGLVNLAPKFAGTKTDAKWKNTGFGVSVGYRF
jgi:hypothetical protein